jgi:hypothetical protein
MANVKQGLYAYLQALSSISSGAFGSRFYPDQAPQNPTFPYCVYYIQDDEKPTHLRGASALSTETISILIYGLTPESRSACSELLRNALHGRINIDFPQDSGTLDVRSIFLQGLNDSFEGPTDGSEQGSFVRQMDFLVTWVEPVPTLP